MIIVTIGICKHEENDKAIEAQIFFLSSSPFFAMSLVATIPESRHLKHLLIKRMNLSSHNFHYSYHSDPN